MAIKYDKYGQPYGEPPYTWEEEQELYRAMSPKQSLTRIHAGPRAPQPPAPPVGPRAIPQGLVHPIGPARTIRHDLENDRCQI